MENLRVIVIPSETENEITPSSSYESIMNCDEKEIYKLPNFFDELNRYEVNLSWCFLVDIEKKIKLSNI